jgi:hypothetical protein
VSEPSAEDQPLAPRESTGDQPREHSEQPVEGGDPDSAAQRGADEPRVHPEDPAEG